jgi:hypothetical protein
MERGRLANLYYIIYVIVSHNNKYVQGRRSGETRRGVWAASAPRIPAAFAGLVRIYGLSARGRPDPAPGRRNEIPAAEEGSPGRREAIREREELSGR